MSGKGSKRRPRKVSRKRFDENWEKAFETPRAKVLRDLQRRREWADEIDRMDEEDVT